jgi:ribonuclease T1
MVPKTVANWRHFVSLAGSARALGVAVLLLAAMAGQARGPVDLGTVPVEALPAEARGTLDLIRAGGPFPYAKDGSIFGNRERLLPPRQRGFYREYTVPTPGGRDRGARRIIAGDGREFYWTADHYRSFQRITGVP